MTRHSSATVHELSQCGLLAELSGERLAELAKEMRREEVASGQGVVLEGDEGDRFYVILGGLFIVSHRARSGRARSCGRASTSGRSRSPCTFRAPRLCAH